MAAEKKGPLEHTKATKARSGSGSSTSLEARSRKRAPRREGRRTTLRLPDELVALAGEAAPELGTTENDVIVLFALEGADLYARRREAARRGEERWQALLRSESAATAGLPSLAEMRRAGEAMRRELAGGQG